MPICRCNVLVVDAIAIVVDKVETSMASNVRLRLVTHGNRRHSKYIDAIYTGVTLGP